MKTSEKIRKFFDKFGNIIYPIITVGIILSLWEILAAAVGKELILPDVASTFRELFSVLGQGDFYLALSFTLVRTLVGFGISLLLAFAFAVLSTLSKTFAGLIEPLVTVMRAVPTMAVILLCLVWFSSRLTPLLVALLIIFPTLYSGLYSAFSNVDERLLEMAKSYRIPKKEIIKSIYVPAVLPDFFMTLKNAVSLNVKLIIAAEVLAGTPISLGTLMQDAKIYLEVPRLIAYAIAAIVLSYLLELFVLLLKKAVVRWK